MCLLVLVSAVALLLSTITTATTTAQNFSNYAHDCAETGYSNDYTTATGSDCAFNVTTRPFPPESFLSLDDCLSFDDGEGQLVGNQGGGYRAHCSGCVGTDAYYYACTCEGFNVSCSLNDFIGVNWTDGSICCNSGTDDSPQVSCGVFGGQKS